MANLTIGSDFAILDVKKGRAALYRALDKANPPTGPRQRGVKVTITGWITDHHSGDDGVSREFGVEVTSVDIGDGEVAEINPPAAA